MSPARWRELVDRRHRDLSIVRQCQLLGVSRSSLYYRAKGTSQQDLSLMRELDRQYLETPFYRSRRMRPSLERQGLPVSPNPPTGSGHSEEARDERSRIEAARP